MDDQDRHMTPRGLYEAYCREWWAGRQTWAGVKVSFREEGIWRVEWKVVWGSLVCRILDSSPEGMLLLFKQNTTNHVSALLSCLP